MKINNEIKIGVMLVAVICILAGITLKTGNFDLSRDSYFLKVRFYNIDGVNLNSPVMLNGFEIGTVDDVVILDDGSKTIMELQCSIKGSVKLRQGTKAFVKNLGFMGEKYVGFISDEAGGDYLKAFDVIVGDEPVDIGALLIDSKEITANVRSISDNIDQRLSVNQKSIDNIFEQTSSTMENLESITSNIDTRIKANEEDIDGIVHGLKAAAINLDELTCDLKNNPWKLTYREKSSRKKCDEGE